MTVPASPRNSAVPGAYGSDRASSLHREARALTGRLLEFDRRQTQPT